MDGLAVEAFTRLPEPDDRVTLMEAARRAYRVSPESAIIPVAGSEQAINLLPHLVPRLIPGARSVAILGPTYGGHARAWTLAGHTVHHIGHLDHGANTHATIVVNPNNPDGRFVSQAVLRHRAEAFPEALLIVDEAFADVQPEASLLDGTELPRNIVVLRSLGKFYGLAGVRLGFAVTGHAVGRSLAAMLGDWAVSGPAIALGTRALRDKSWADANRARLQAQSAKLDAVLAAAGLDAVGGTSLFRFVRTDLTLNIFNRLAQQGILVRPFVDLSSLRFGIPADDEALERLTHALQQTR